MGTREFLRRCARWYSIQFVPARRNPSMIFRPRILALALFCLLATRAAGQPDTSAPGDGRAAEMPFLHLDEITNRFTSGGWARVGFEASRATEEELLREYLDALERFGQEVLEDIPLRRPWKCQLDTSILPGTLLSAASNLA